MRVVFSSRDFVVFFVSLSLVVGISRVFGELLRRRGLPHVAGEILTGILLGKTIAGRLLPGLFHVLFPSSGPVFVAFEGLKSLSFVLIMFVAGLETNITSFLRYGRGVIAAGFFSFAIPFSLGYVMSGFFAGFLGCGSHSPYFPLFLGAAFSISSIPVVARVLVDLNILKSDVGLVILGASCINNLLGWIAFSIVLGTLSPFHRSFHFVVFSVVIFVFLSLTLGVRAVDRLIKLFQARMDWPGSVISMSVAMSLLGASLTEWLGVHGVLGAFLAGMVFGGSSRLKERTRDIIFGFVMSIFSPIFFGSMAIHFDFVGGFNPLLFFSLLFSFVLHAFWGVCGGEGWGC